MRATPSAPVGRRGRIVRLVITTAIVTTFLGEGALKPASGSSSVRTAPFDYGYTCGFVPGIGETCSSEIGPQTGVLAVSYQSAWVLDTYVATGTLSAALGTTFSVPGPGTVTVSVDVEDTFGIVCIFAYEGPISPGMRNCSESNYATSIATSEPTDELRVEAHLVSKYSADLEVDLLGSSLTFAFNQYGTALIHSISFAFTPADS